MHWHRSHFNDVSQRCLSILLQAGPGGLSLSAFARLLHKSSEVTRLALRPWEQQKLIVTEHDRSRGEPTYKSNVRHIGSIKRCLKGAFYEHAALGELYFAYGSNLNPARLEARGIQPRFLARAQAHGFRLGFPRRMRDGGGVAGMLPASSGTVEGALYLLTDDEFAILDQYEDAPRSYFRTPLLVSIGAPQAQPIVPRLCVTTYEAVPSTPGPPAEDYLGHMISGARFWGLSSATIEFLEAITPIAASKGNSHGARRLHPMQSSRHRSDRKRRSKRRR